jgi:hemerythrin
MLNVPEREAMLIHDNAVKRLAPADYIMIEEEHGQLKKFLDDLQDTCLRLDTILTQETASDLTATYRGRLPSFLFYITELVAKHFSHEEAIMLSRPKVTDDDKYFRRHQQAHTEIIQKLDILVDECFSLDTQVSIAEIYHQFHQKLSALFEEHDRAFDDPFIQSTKS